MNTVTEFIQLFRGRGDVYGSAKGFCVHEQLTPEVFEQHLTSTNPEDWIGVYCMIGEEASWGCVDIDGKDFPLDIENKVWDWAQMWTIASNLRTVLAVKDIHAFIERTKNGYHVWVFPDSPTGLVPARAMRRALMAACVAIDYDPNEVNPKAEGPRPGTKGYGNFVRLPYGGVLTAPGRKDRIFVSDDGSVEYELDAFLGKVERTSLAALENVARLWTPPPPPSTEVDFDAGLDAWECVKLLDGKGYTIWKEGPLPGSDRSTTLARLAHIAAERGLTATQTYAVIKSADVRWGGKFAQRADGEEQLARLVENAY